MRPSQPRLPGLAPSDTAAYQPVGSPPGCLCFQHDSCTLIFTRYTNEVGMGIWQKAVASVISASPSLQLRAQPLVMHFLPLAGWVIDGFGLLTDLCYSTGWVKLGGSILEGEQSSPERKIERPVSPGLLGNPHCQVSEELR